MPINIQPIWQEKLTSPTCPFCRQEMSLTEHDVDQDGSTIIVWECDFCRALIEVNVYPPDDPNDIVRPARLITIPCTALSEKGEIVGVWDEYELELEE